MKTPTLHQLSAVLLLALAPALALPQQAAAPSQAERIIRFRQSTLYLLAWNVVPIAEMVQGKRPYDAAVAERNARTIALLAPRLAEGFPEGTQSGAPTRAKPEIWQDLPDFRNKLAALERSSAAFAEVARSGDLERIKPAMTTMINDCKACHDKYRSD